jgi:hypothetical protein
MSKPLAALAVEQEAAQRAVEDGHWAEAAQRWRAIATTTDGFTARRAFHQAACAHARRGDLDDAFAMLGAALSVLAFPLAELNAPELETLRSDPRWPALLAHATTTLAAWEATLGQPEIRRELLLLRDEDQAVRVGPLSAAPQTPEGFLAVDVKTSLRVREIIAAHGWPGFSLVGQDGADAAWLIVQHATHDRAFQEDCLARLQDAVARGEAEARHVAYLEDRLATTAGRPQRYGTQFTEHLEPHPIEDEEHLDERRRAVGLSSMAAYTRLIRKRYGG